MKAQLKKIISCNFRDMEADSWYSLFLLRVQSRVTFKAEASGIRNTGT